MWSVITAREDKQKMGTNLWKRFERLLPSQPLLIVTVDSVNGDGTSTVSTSGGGGMRVLGSSVAAGKKAYVQYGKIQGEAPNLAHYELEI